MAPKKKNQPATRSGASAAAIQSFAASNPNSRTAKSAPVSSNLKIAQDVIANPGNYDQGYTRDAFAANPDSVIGRGLYGGGLPSQDGQSYGLQGFYVPGATTGIGPNKDVLFAAGPNANQEWLNANFGPGGRYYGGGAGSASTSNASSGGSAATQPSNIKQALRSVGEGGITRNELNKIVKDYGKSEGSVIQRLDQVNQGLKGKDKTGINLNSGAVNMLINKARKKPATGYDSYLNMISGSPQFGTGRIGSTLQARMDATDMLGNKGNPMLGGTAIRPGGRETVRGFGKQYTMPTTSSTIGTEAPAGSTTPGGSSAVGESGPAIEDTTPMTPEDMKANSTFGIGADLSSWATGFKAKQSSRKRAGRGAQGLASQRVNPTGAFRGTIG